MAALEWLLIPVIGGVAAGLWVVWADRRRKQAGDINSLAGYARFHEAMAKSHSAGPEV